MKKTWFFTTLTLPLLIACNGQGSSIKVSSETISQKQIDTIVSNIENRYPEAPKVQKQNAAEVVVRAIENLVFVEGGSFDMGDFRMDCDFPSRNENRLDWSPDAQCLSSDSSGLSGAMHLHNVTLDSYSISKYETSFLDMEWMRLINDLPVADSTMVSLIPPNYKPVLRSSNDYQELIERHSKVKEAAKAKYWQEAKDYCQWLGNMSGLPFDLPTEAQWEYAARSRGQHYYYATNNGYRNVRGGKSYYDATLDRYVKIKPSEVNTTSSMSIRKEIGQWPPNPLGVYDMSNGVSEWVNDWFARDYYLESPENNPQGPEIGTQKVSRGGKTFDRSNPGLQIEIYSVLQSFRCALQSEMIAY